MLQDEDGQTVESHSISAGLDYPGVGPEHAFLRDIGRAEYVLGHRHRGDGRLPAAVPHRGDHPGDRVGPRRSPARCAWVASSARASTLLVNLSGRGDKDVDTAARWFDVVDAASLPTGAPDSPDAAAGEREL